MNLANQPHAVLVSKGWWWRELEIRVSNESFRVSFTSSSFSFNQVLITQPVVPRETYYGWWGTRGAFPLGIHVAEIEVRRWPWATPRTFRLTLDGAVLYSEG